MKNLSGRQRIISATLILAMTGSILLNSCAGNSIDADSSSPTDNQNAQNNTASSTEATTERIKHDVPDIDFEGYDFKSVVRSGDIYWSTVDVYAEIENADPINDAVYRRNKILEDKFNITISEIRQQDNIMPYVQKLILSGSDDFDVFYPTMNDAGTLVQQGLLNNLYDIQYLSFDKPWWNKTTNDSLSIGNKLYAAAGDITTMANDATWTVLFNKALLRDYGLTNPYDLVKAGKWTLDVLHENSKIATKDLNSDGVLEPEDQWGTIGQHETAYSLFAGTGQKIAEKNEEDLPVLSFNSERTIAALTKVIDFLSDDFAQIKADDAKNSKYTNVWVDISNKGFSESRALYMVTNFEMAKTLRNMDADFGMLPLPKFDENQEMYYSTMQYNNATALCVPVTAANPNRTGAILEAWAAESVTTLTVAYYEKTLKGKVSRDDESAEMLDLIFSSRVIDSGMFFNWAGLMNVFYDFSKAKKLDFASKYEKLEPQLIKAIERTIKAIEDNNE
ncbi:hypothetical protein FACS1894219_09580 [Clostridia bacterium]|nr:hypothetical protein FACS1894219_09580 [Clostridia bacterium]